MAEDTVVKEQLTDAMIEAGAEITRKLDEMGASPVAALWLFSSDSNEWRLRFSFADLDTIGPRKGYERVQEAIRQLGKKAAATPLAVIVLLNPNDRIIKSLRTAFQIGPQIGRVRVSKNAINGHYFEDGLVYRIT